MKYRVDIWTSGPGCWAEYTSRTALVGLDFAKSLFTHLRRNHTRTRIVESPGDRVVMEWTPESGFVK